MGVVLLDVEESYDTEGWARCPFMHLTLGGLVRVPVGLQASKAQSKAFVKQQGDHKQRPRYMHAQPLQDGVLGRSDAMARGPPNEATGPW
jgi:hypothetical protein